MNYKKTIKKLYNILENELSPELTYHGIHHTRDVQKVCQFYIKHYQIDKVPAQLLEIAAVGHDIGFTKNYKNHEEESVVITTEIMREDGFKEHHIQQVSEMILATKVPQNPNNFLSSLLCDADLDYLGREDFSQIGATLKQEWKNYDIFLNLDDNFDIIQIGFLKGHCYHNDYAKEHRAPIKLKHLEHLERQQVSKTPK